MPPVPASIGRYQVVSRLGEGGMGTVYLAKDPELQRTVAIKILSAYSDQSAHGDELRERFSREARSVAGLKHNNIVTIFDIGEDDGRPYIVMEFIDGESMAEMIRRRAPLALDRKLGLILELCSGLGYAHRSSIIHRDIKPANLMITSDGVLKILDFGLARLTTEATNAGLTRHGALMGTPQYMSPEQIQGGGVDHRSDIFGVGLVTYELLTYRRAFLGDTAPVILHNIVTSKPRPLRELIPSIDAQLEQAVNQAIETNPAARYQSLSDLAADLTRVRRRVIEGSLEETIRVDQHSVDRQAIAEKRAKQIEMHLQIATRLFDEGRYETAVENAEQALLLDPQEKRVLDLLKRAHRARDEEQVRQWLDQAQTVLARGAFTEAEALVEQTLKLRPGSADAQRLRQQIKEARREHERRAERTRVVRLATERGRASLKNGALESAIRSADEALAYDSEHEEARALRREAVAALEQQRRQQDEQRAMEAVAQAKRQAAGDDIPGALALLRKFTPAHQIVTTAIADLERQLEKREGQERAAAHKADARSALQEGRFSDALTALDLAETTVVGDPDVARLRKTVEVTRAEADAAKQRADEAERNLAEAEACVRRDDLKGAMRLLNASLALQPGNPRALQLRARVQELTDAQKRQEEEKRAADTAIAKARKLFQKGDQNGAFRLLENFTPQALVARTLEELREKHRQRPSVAPAKPAPRPAVSWNAFADRRVWLALGAVGLVIVVAGTLYINRVNRAVDKVSEPESSPTVVSRNPSPVPPPPAAVVQVPVTIDVHPWARVTITSAAGAKVGKEPLITPFTIPLDPGEYTLTCVNDRLSPPITDTFRITVREGQPQTLSRPLRGFDTERLLNSLLGPRK
jgi:tRNA A-37 threonylcarbamoyl transferase component Bud32/tetratricopeptide (TPR) repeat protein